MGLWLRVICVHVRALCKKNKYIYMHTFVTLAISFPMLSSIARGSDAFFDFLHHTFSMPRIIWRFSFCTTCTLLHGLYHILFFCLSLSFSVSVSCWMYWCKSTKTSSIALLRWKTFVTTHTHTHTEITLSIFNHKFWWQNIISTKCHTERRQLHWIEKCVMTTFQMCCPTVSSSDIYSTINKSAMTGKTTRNARDENPTLW